jgi:hypothetical protein
MCARPAVELMLRPALGGPVHRHDRLRSLGHEGLEAGLVEVQRVGPDVGKDRPGAAKHERVDRRDERERRHDHQP